MKILVTGAAGLIGSHLTEKLLALGHQVTGLDNLTTGTLSNLEKVARNPNFNFIKGDILDAKLVDECVAGRDVIFHLAAAVGVKIIMDQPLQSMITNVVGTGNILSAADRHRTKIFIASTSEVYGKNTKLPFDENDDRTMGPTTKLRWHYAESKALDEFLALAYYDERGLPVVITRFFNTTGPRQSADYGMVVPKFIEKALHNEPIPLFNGGQQQRCFSDAEDIVEALVELLNCEAAVGQVINLGNTEEISIRQLAELIIKLTGSHSQLTDVDPATVYGKRFEDMARRIPNLTKIKNLTGWQPTTSIEEIVKKFIAIN